MLPSSAHKSADGRVKRAVGGIPSSLVLAEKGCWVYGLARRISYKNWLKFALKWAWYFCKSRFQKSFGFLKYMSVVVVRTGTRNCGESYLVKEGNECVQGQLT
jgi:hypothetical protein